MRHDAAAGMTALLQAFYDACGDGELKAERRTRLIGPPESSAMVQKFIECLSRWQRKA
jgi:hypothetical protein